MALNALMFFVEVGAGFVADSRALQADALDFLGDTANYAISLGVAGMALSVRSRAALVKGATILIFGLWVIGSAIWAFNTGTQPEPGTMGLVSMVALAVNFGIAVMLYRYRSGDANMRSVWICSRNDAVGNIAVIGAAIGVFGTGDAWPDLLVAAIMAALAIYGGAQIILHALDELRSARDSELQALLQR